MHSFNEHLLFKGFSLHDDDILYSVCRFFLVMRWPLNMGTLLVCLETNTNSETSKMNETFHPLKYELNFHLWKLEHAETKLRLQKPHG